MTALVPHQFWNEPKSRTSQIGGVSMYFDDRERLDDVEGKLRKPMFGNNQWIMSLSNEKRLAVEKFLGYNQKTASKLTDEQVEEETLRWVVDTDIILAADDDDASSSDNTNIDVEGNADRQRVTFIKYGGIKDLLVASSCNSTLQSLTFLWNAIADALEDEISSLSTSSSSSSNPVKLIVFPKSEALWNYDNIVTMLEAIKIALPLLPTKFNLRLDLFHPDFKHSPRMWSPQWHSPFPTVGFTIKAKKETSIDQMDLDIIRGKLDVLFQSVDATCNAQNSSEDTKQILEDCQSWLQTEHGRKRAADPTIQEYSNKDDVDWIVDSRGSPFQLYRTLWNSVLSLSTCDKSASLVIDPVLDSHTLHRVAVTVNAALKRLDLPVRISEVFHPFAKSAPTKNKHKTRPPYGMIQLSPYKRKPQ
eukprot:CAMPEP_0201128254 /NCGR_PEP_ID=MMETSP0850-20130426/33111_1 /ASSEMBLY_ACC=CAM_ASM_000622 /TAXON_ID=183588 /ORGANISM="Pseudo-nitzschia fraudulenta, Strain WWA7" /LENGTH=417 /DNA_ID=CAMNT_0047397375 /DNA_START=51 /DNA_END=1304 /DNA_ORIENTATION=+